MRNTPERQWALAQQVLAIPEQYLEWVPEVEREIVYRLLCGEKQADLAKVCGATEQGISHRAVQAARWLRVLENYPDVEWDLILEEMQKTKHPVPAQVSLVIATFLDTGSIAKTAEAYNQTQQWVRHLMLGAAQALGKSPATKGSRLHYTLTELPQLVRRSANSKIEFRARPPAQIIAKAFEIDPPDEPATDNGSQEMTALLRQCGPMKRIDLVALLDAKGFNGSSTVFSAAKRKQIFSVLTGKERLCLLLPPAAKNVAQSFQIDWSAAIKRFCACYDAFTMEDVQLHLGIPRRAIRVLEDNLSIVKDILRAQGFIETNEGWRRKRPRRRKLQSPKALQRQILSLLEERGILKMHELTKALGLPQRTIYAHLQPLIRKGKVATFGHRSATVYCTL